MAAITAAYAILTLLYSNSATPTKGLTPPKANSRNKYSDVWFKFIKMMMMAAAPSSGSDEDDDQHEKYRAFGDIVLNDTIADVTRTFVQDIQDIILGMRLSRAQFKFSQTAFPVLRRYFIALIDMRPPAFHERFKKYNEIFMASSMIS